MKHIIFSLFLFVVCIGFTNAQTSLDGVGTYSEDFNTLANTGTSSGVPSGWSFFESGTNADSTYRAGTGSSTTGDTYSFGASSDNERAFGCLRSGTLIPMIGAQFINNTGSTITQIPISYTGETWRVGTISRSDRLDFQYSTDATSLSTGTWTDFDTLDYVNPGQGAIGSGSMQHSANIAATITGLSIANGSTFWIRWIDFDASGSDDGMAVDNFSINETALPVEIISFNAVTKGRGVELAWKTATEVNNHGFEIQRSEVKDQMSAVTWAKVGFVEGAGNSNAAKEYSFIDKVPVSGKYLYRLKQVDNDGKFEYSSSVEVNASTLASGYELAQNHPNPFNPTTNIAFALAKDEFVTLKVYDMLGKEIATLVNNKQSAGAYTVPFNASAYPSGIYFYTLRAGNSAETKKMLLVK